MILIENDLFYLFVIGKIIFVCWSFISLLSLFYYLFLWFEIIIVLFNDVNKAYWEDVDAITDAFASLREYVDANIDCFVSYWGDLDENTDAFAS